MPNSGIIDLAIGLTVILGVSAAISSVITELITRLVGLRGMYLLRGLRALLDRDEAEPDLTKAQNDYGELQTLIRHKQGADTSVKEAEPGLQSVTGALLGSPVLRSHGMVDQFSSQEMRWQPPRPTGRSARLLGGALKRPWREYRSLPSCIPARSFAEALIDLVMPDLAGQTSMSAIYRNVNLLPDSMSTLRGSLRALAVSAGDDIDLFRTSVEHWYNDHMDRVSGWYKRHVAKITFAVGAILVLLFNVNVLTTGRVLYNDSIIRAAVNAVAAKSTTCPYGPDQQTCLADLRAQLSAKAQAGLPIGWATVSDCAVPNTPCNWLDRRGIFSRHGDSGGQVAHVLIGFLITIMVLVPGAQAWFGLWAKVRKRRGFDQQPARTRRRYHQKMTSGSDKVRPRPRRDTVLGIITLGWLVLGVVAIVVGFVAISSEAVTDRTVLAAVALAGAAGGCLSGAAAVSSYVGQRAFRASWTAYFSFRPLLGAGISLLLYFLIRAGLISASAPVSALNRYGILALSFLSGVFSKIALDKILAVSDIVFGRGSSLIATAERNLNPPRALRDLDPYHGFIVYELTPAPDSKWLLRIWLQPNVLPDQRCYELRVGEGPVSAAATFRFTIFQHDYQSVMPESGTIESMSHEERSKPLIFQFFSSEGADDPPVALIEVSQHGRTVAVVSTYDPNS